MTGLFHEKSRRTTACIVALMMLVLVLSSSLFLIREAGHSCSGDSCPVCAGIRHCKQVLRHSGHGTGFFQRVPLPALLPVLSVTLFVYFSVKSTPVDRRTRLNR